MEYRSLGRTGVQVSKLCLGCMNFGGPSPEDESISIIDAAIDAGVNFLDSFLEKEQKGILKLDFLQDLLQKIILLS